MTACSLARTMLVRAGYGLTKVKVDASYHNVPQRRKHFIVIGRLGAQDGFLSSALAEAKWAAVPAYLRPTPRIP